MSERAKNRYQEFLDFREAYPCTFREWLKVRTTDWYRRVKNGEHIKQWWEDGYEG